MYRIDGKRVMKLAWKDVRCIVIKFHTTKMNFLLKNENDISLFDYEEAKVLIEEIETPSFEYKIKKQLCINNCQRMTLQTRY